MLTHGAQRLLLSDRALRVVKVCAVCVRKDNTNVFAVTGNNVSTNCAMSRRIGPTFVGYQIHRFNLFVQEILDQYCNIISNVQALMKKLSYQISAAQLRALTPLKPKLSNDTLWSSTYEILVRYPELFPFISRIDSEEIRNLIPNNDDNEKIQGLRKSYQTLNQSTKSVNAIPLLSAMRGHFLKQSLPKTHRPVTAFAKIHVLSRMLCLSPSQSKFKIEMQQNYLRRKSTLFAHLKLSSASNEPIVTEGTTDLSFAQHILKKPRGASGKLTPFLDEPLVYFTNLEWLQASVFGGWLYSYGQAQTYKFRGQLFLKFNTRFWGLKEGSELDNDNQTPSDYSYYILSCHYDGHNATGMIITLGHESFPNL